MRTSLELKALAKINLGLDVLGRRENGYHDVRMVMQTIYLYDNVTLRKIKKPGIRLKTNLYYLPVDDKNVAYKAAKMLMDEFEIEGGIEIILEKRIPVAAGMAGGSSNAAAVLVGMNYLYELGLSERQLMDRGVKLGADVPYCIMRGTVLAEGIGEILTPLSPMPKCFILVAKPNVSVSTKTIYEKLDAHEIKDHPDIDGLIEGLDSGDIRKIADSMGNVLERVTVEAYPVIEVIKNRMKEEGALGAMMSGSGPTVFGIFADKRVAKRAQQKIKELEPVKQAYVVNVHNNRRKQQYGSEF